MKYLHVCELVLLVVEYAHKKQHIIQFNPCVSHLVRRQDVTNGDQDDAPLLGLDGTGSQMLGLTDAHFDARGELGHLGLPLRNEVAGRHDERRAGPLAGQHQGNDRGRLPGPDGIGQDAAARSVLGKLAREGIEARTEGAVLLDEEASVQGTLLMGMERQGHGGRRRRRGMRRRQTWDGQRRAVSLLGAGGGHGGCAYCVALLP